MDYGDNSLMAWWIHLAENALSDKTTTYTVFCRTQWFYEKHL